MRVAFGNLTRLLALTVACSLVLAVYVRQADRELSLLPARPPIVLRMRRTCEGCPNYVITLHSDGGLVYEGGDHTLVPGARNFYIDRATANKLIDDFLQSDFVEMETLYPAPGSDHMTLSLSIEMDGLTKSVLSEEHYGPAILRTLEREMDDLPGMRALSGWTH